MNNLMLLPLFYLISPLFIYLLVKKFDTSKLALLVSLVILTNPLHLNFNPNLYSSSIQTIALSIVSLLAVSILPKQKNIFYYLLPLILHLPLFFLNPISVSNLSQYFDYFSPHFLFIQANWQNPIHPKIYSGALLWPSLIFLPLGLFNYPKSNSDKLFLSWLLISPLISLTSFAIPLSYFVAKGIIKTINHFSSSISIKLIILSTYFISFAYYLDIFFNKNPLIK